MAAFSPFVALLGEHGADQADQRVAVGKDADHVGAPADLAVEPLAGVVGPDLPRPLWERRGRRARRRERPPRARPPFGSLSASASSTRPNYRLLTAERIGSAAR